MRAKMRGEHILKHDKKHIKHDNFCVTFKNHSYRSLKSQELHQDRFLSQLLKLLCVGQPQRIVISGIKDGEMGRWRDCQSRNQACKMVRPANHQSPITSTFSA